MMPPAEDIARHIASLAIGTFAGAVSWGVYAHQEPMTPDEVITIYDTGGGSPDTDELDLLNPTFQVRVRSATYASAYVKHEAIRDALILPGRLVTANSEYLGIVMTSDIISIGQDDNQRFILTANYRAIRERT